MNYKGVRRQSLDDGGRAKMARFQGEYKVGRLSDATPDVATNSGDSLADQHFYTNIAGLDPGDRVQGHEEPVAARVMTKADVRAEKQAKKSCAAALEEYERAQARVAECAARADVAPMGPLPFGNGVRVRPNQFNTWKQYQAHLKTPQGMASLQRMQQRAARDMEGLAAWWARPRGGNAITSTRISPEELFRRCGKPRDH